MEHVCLYCAKGLAKVVADFIIRKRKKMTSIEIDLINTYIDYLLRKGDFETVDTILKINKTDDCHNIDEKLAYLTATLPAKSKLPSRESYYAWFESYLEMIKDPERIELLKGLK